MWHVSISTGDCCHYEFLQIPPPPLPLLDLHSVHNFDLKVLKLIVFRQGVE